MQTQADTNLTRDLMADAIRRCWKLIASTAEAAANQPKQNMDAYVAITSDLEHIRELIINAPVDTFSDTLNKKGSYSDE